VRLALRLLLVDDQVLFREGIEAILSVRLPDTILCCAEDAQQAEAALHLGGFDCVLLDIDLGADNGLELLQCWRQTWPDLPIVMLSGSLNPQHMSRALQLGARGFVPKSCNGSLLVGALDLVRAGGTYVPPELLLAMREPLPLPITAMTTSLEEHGLTPRQIDVLQMLAQGCSNKEIARRLEMADGTVRTHINAVFRALEVTNRTQAVMRAQELGCL
jgi:DNA-binding NarL/FixJ family response regulator